MHPSAYESARLFVAEHLDLSARLSIIDVGAYDVNGCVRPLFDNPNWSYTGLDMVGGPNVDLIATQSYQWPVVSDAYDVAISLNTVEHVQQPWNWIVELSRIVKPGGIVFICAPHTLGFHEYPIDCWRAWPDGMRGLFKHAGIAEIDIHTYGIDTVAIGRKP